MTKKRVTELTKKIIEYSKENTAGSLLTEDGIKAVLSKCDKKTDSKLFVEARIDENQSDSGYLVKAADFLDALKPEKPEKPEPEKEPEQKIHRKKINKFLQVKYTDDQMKEIYTGVARKNGEMALAELNKKSAASQFKSEIDKLQAEISELCEKLLIGEETQSIECDVTYDYEKNRKVITRSDTLETIFDDVIPNHEQQTEMYNKDETETAENTTSEQQPPDTEPDTPETGQSDGEGAETEESQDKALVDIEPKSTDINFSDEIDKQQAELDAEDAKIAEDIGRNLDTSKKDTSMPPLPNE